MGYPRRHYVREGEEGVYHCFNRCVRRAFLYGFDPLTGRNFSHRKAWLVDRLRHLAAVFAIDVCSFSVMENHYHGVLRTRPDLVATWSDREVATRWLTFSPGRRDFGGSAVAPTEKAICALASCPKRIAQLRRRLSSLSWFMGGLNEYIARAANKEDGVKGRFWEGRFKSQALLDEAAIAACMVYVDLNPIRAGQAGTPEESDFTSIQERIHAWQRETKRTASVFGAAAPDIELDSSCGSYPVDGTTVSGDWLCPIQSDSGRRGILQMTTGEYIELVDMSGRLTRSGKRGAIDAELLPILLRIGARPEAWQETISRFGVNFCLAAGLLAHLRSFADRIGGRWLKGVTAARFAFALSPPQSA